MDERDTSPFVVTSLRADIDPTATATATPSFSRPGPLITFVGLADESKRSGASLIIFPGGGYHKVEVNKEGLQIAQHFAKAGFVSFVVDYRLGDSGFLSIRAKTVGVPLYDAVQVLAFVRWKCTEHDTRFGPLDIARIGLVGFSAGGHLALCLCGWDGGCEKMKDLVDATTASTTTTTTTTTTTAAAASSPELMTSNSTSVDSRKDPRFDIDSSLVQSPPSPHPPIHSVMLVYPTLRSPTCWCIVGGLWVGPSSLGQSWPYTGEHTSCFGCCEEALSSLLPKLPQNILAVTFTGDLLLPAFKNASLFIKAVRDYRAPRSYVTAVTAGDRGRSSSIRSVHPPLCSLVQCQKEEKSDQENDIHHTNSIHPHHSDNQTSCTGMMEEARDDVSVQYLHGGPFYLPHGFGLHSSWASKASDWLRTVTSDVV